MTFPRRAFAIAIFGLAAFIAADSVAWFWATTRLLAGWDAWLAQAAAYGLHVRSSPPTRSGWPFSAEITLPDASIDAGPATWRADAVRLAVSPRHPASLAVAVQGRQRFRLDGLPAIDVTAVALGAVVPFEAGAPVTLAGHGLTAAVEHGTIEAGVLDGQIDAGGLDIAASRLLAPGARLPYGGIIDHLSAHVRVTALAGRAVPQDLRAAAVAWAQAGGQVVADEVALRWGPLDARGHLTAGLDARLQPAGTGTLHMAGYDALIEALAGAGAIGRDTGLVAATVLDMMATHTEPPVVDAPLRLQEGTLSMGAIPLARTPPLTWP